MRQFEDDDEREEGEGEDREAIANELFDGSSDHVNFISSLEEAIITNKLECFVFILAGRRRTS